MARRCSKKNDAEDLVMNFIVFLLMLPLIGLFLVGSKDPTKKTIGTVLLVVGLVVWLMMSCGG